MAGDFHGTEIRQIFIVIEGEKSFGLRLTLDVYFYKIQKFLREGRGKTGYKRVTNVGGEILDFGLEKCFVRWVRLKVVGRASATATGRTRAHACSGLRPRCPAAGNKVRYCVGILRRAIPQSPAGFRRGRRKRHAMARALPSNAARAAFSHHFQIHPDALGDLQKSRDRCLVLSKISIEGWHMGPSFFLLPLNVSR